MATSDPICPATALLPTGSPGGIRTVHPCPAGTLRPFATTLGVPSRPDAKKHDTSATRDSHQTTSETINDGTRSNDSVTDTDVDD